MESVYFKIDYKTLVDLKQLAQKDSRSVANLVGIIVKKYVEENKFK